MENNILSSLAAEVASMKTQIAAQERQIQNLQKQLNAQRQSHISKNHKFFPGMVLGFGFSLVLFVFLLFPSGVAESRIIVNPLGYTNQFGAILLPNGSTFSDQPSDTNAKYGLIASGNPTLSLTSLPFFDTGVYAAGSGQGVYATSNSSQGYGVFASNTATSGSGNGYAIYGRSTRGIGVTGESNGNNAGVYGTSSTGAGLSGFSGTGSGIYASSATGAPLSIQASNTPINGTRAFGDVYIDPSGKMYIWAKNDAGTVSNWRQLQFAT